MDSPQTGNSRRRAASSRCISKGVTPPFSQSDSLTSILIGTEAEEVLAKTQRRKVLKPRLAPDPNRAILVENAVFNQDGALSCHSEICLRINRIAPYAAARRSIWRDSFQTFAPLRLCERLFCFLFEFSGSSRYALRVTSIIIPLKHDQGYLKPCIEACVTYAGSNTEIIVLPDDPLPWNDPRIIVEATGPVSPARKRNRGAQIGKGDILVFIDDDTRPRFGWLEAALAHFKDPRIGAVGGPSITPASDPFMAQVSGVAYESWMMSGSERYRYRPEAERDVDDFPSCNLIVRRCVFDTVGGFGTDFWPGEDTEFCLAVVKKGFRIRYEPRAVIEHHRRPTLAKHLRQLANYGLHRGYFVKKFPETSRRPAYFAPSAMVIVGTALAFGTLMGSLECRWLLGFLATVYAVLTLISLPKHRLVGTAIVFLSHLTYGTFFVMGLLAQKLPEEKIQ